jgi:hypothetical protein
MKMRDKSLTHSIWRTFAAIAFCSLLLEGIAVNNAAMAQQQQSQVVDQTSSSSSSSALEQQQHLEGTSFQIDSVTFSPYTVLAF